LDQKQEKERNQRLKEQQEWDEQQERDRQLRQNEQQELEEHQKSTGKQKKKK
jgi:hypothetical protein